MATVISFIGSIMDPIMGWIYRLCGSFGMTILLFTVLSKTVMLPLSVWVHMNGIKVIRMQPAINRIKIEHYGDKDAIADGQAALYKKEKYSPIVSLIPLLFQILMGVMAVIRNPSFRIHHMHFLGLDMSKTASANRADAGSGRIEFIAPFHGAEQDESSAEGTECRDAMGNPDLQCRNQPVPWIFCPCWCCAVLDCEQFVGNSTAVATEQSYSAGKTH